MPVPPGLGNLPAGNPLDGPPPLPPSAPPAQQQGPTYKSLAPQQQQATPGMNQINEKAIQVAYEIDMAIKLLAQMVPQLGPWAMTVLPELHQQLGMALAAGAPASPEPQGNSLMPDGSANL